MSAPRILLIDEPSVGLAPLLVARTIDKIKELKDGFQLTVLMAEQNFTQAIRIADRGYVIVHGRIEFEGASAAELNNNELIREFYLGRERRDVHTDGHSLTLRLRAPSSWRGLAPPSTSFRDLHSKVVDGRAHPRVKPGNMARP